MILLDTDVLSAFAKVARLSLLFTLFQTPSFFIAPAVLAELAHSLVRGRQYAADVFACVAVCQLQVVTLTEDEARLQATLPQTLGAGERESMAIAHARGGTVLSNESRVAYYCHQMQIPCVRLPAILRALWIEGIIPRAEVHALIEDLQNQDRMQFTPATLQAIFNS